MRQNDPSSPGGRRQSWRGGGSVRGSTENRSGSHAWKGTRQSAADVEFSGRRRRLLAWRVGWSSAALALVVWLIAMLVGVRRPVPLVSGILAYAHPLGPIALAEEDRDLLQGLWRGDRLIDRGTARFVDITESLAGADAADFIDACGNAVASQTPGGPERCVILYLTAFGAVDRSGKPCLVPGRVVGSTVAADEAWVRVEDLLKKIAERRPRRAGVLVVLDACRPAHAAALGVFDGAFAAALEPAVRAAAHDRLWVIASAGPGEVANAWPEDGGSLFASTFVDAIEGAADGDADGRVEIQELQQYLAAEVSRKARGRHGVRQQPFITAATGDDKANPGLSWAVRNKPADRAAETFQPSAEGAEWLATRWSRAEQLRERAVTERPAEWAAYEMLLLRAERLREAGRGFDREFKEMRVRVEEAERHLQRPLFESDGLPGVRLAHLAGLPLPPPADLWTDGLQVWKESVVGQAATATVVDAVPPCRDQAEWSSRAEAAWDAVVTLVGNGATIDREAWRRWDKIVGDPPAADAVVPFEIHAARLLVSGLGESGWKSATAPKLVSRVAMLAGQAAEAALPFDVRADSFVNRAAPIRDAEISRRTAFDLLVAGDEARSSEAARIAAAGYGRATDAGRVASEAWRFLDTVRAELPWLALWHADVARTRTADHSDWRQLDQAIDRLQATLASGDPAPDAAVIQAAFVAADQLYAKLRGDYEDACERLDRAAENAATLADLRSVLAVPLVDGAPRMRLITRVGRIAETERSRAGDPGPVTPQSQSADGRPQDLTAGWVDWEGGNRIHPYVAAVGVGDGRGTRPSTSGAELATVLGTWGQAIRAAIDQTGLPADDVSGTDIAKAAAWNRRKASVSPASFLGAETWDKPVQMELGRAWHARLSRVADSMLSDLFASTEFGRSPWFVAAARICLDHAGELGDEQACEQVRRRLEGLEGVSGSWARLEASPDRIDASAIGKIRASVAISEPVGSAPMEPGAAALWLTDGAADEPLQLLPVGGSSRAPQRRIPLPIARPGGDGRPEAVEWRVDSDPAGLARIAERTGSTMQLVAWFRGHRLFHEIPVGGASAAPVLVWRRPAPQAPRVTVRGSDERRGYVSFIFDCSGSMRDPAPNGRKRFDVGRETLDEVLQAMAKAGTWDASLWLYGHRTKWVKVSSNPDRYQPGLSEFGSKERDAKAAAGEPFSLQPGMDVQRVLSMQTLGPGQAREVVGLLSRLAPAGETPLYLALREALSDDAPANRDAAWRIVLVTDGVNDQTDVTPLTTDRDVRETLAAVNRMRSTKVHIDIVAFDLRAQDVKKNELASLARGSGGQFVEAAVPEALLDALRKSLGLKQWKASGGEAFAESAELGAALDLPLVAGASAVPYRIALEGATAAAEVVVRGGEGLELAVSASGRTLEHQRYKGGTEQPISDRVEHLDDPADSQVRWFVAAHLPRREGQDVRFPVSVQNDDETKFSPRPVEWWAEVEPVGVPSEPYVFVDADFEMGRPVPVVDLLVPGWPREAKEAAIRIWFSTKPIDADATLALGDLEEGVEKVLDVAGLSGVVINATLEKPAGAGRGRVTIVERHPPGRAEDLPLLRVRLEPECERASHAVDVADAEVRHEFDFPLDAAGNVPTGTQVSFVYATRLKELSVKPPAPGGAVKSLRVTLPTD